MSRSRLLRTLGTLGAAALAAAGLAGCVGTPGGIQASDSWTIMSYDAADNDLEINLLEDLVEKAAVGSQPGLNIISLFDRAEGQTDTAVLNLPDWTGTKLLQVEPGSVTELFDYDDLNMGDPDVLASFIRETIRAFPASNYALVISDHGAGWPGIAVDYSAGGDSLTLEELESAIASGLTQAGVPKLDLIGFDACLMSTYEVASAMAPYAERMLASQETIPLHGWDYTALEAAFRGGTVDELSGALIEAYREQAITMGTETEITLSLLDLSRFGEVEQAVSEFATAMTERVRDVAPAVGRTLAETLGFGRNPDPDSDSHLTDLGILAGEISVDAVGVAPQAEAVVRAVNDVVIDKIDGQATRGATGISIYFPPDGQYYDEPYADLPVDSTWDEFLTTYYTAGDDIPIDAQPTFTSDTASVEFDDGGLYIVGGFDGRLEQNVSDAYFYYGLANSDGTIDFLGDEPAEVSSDGSGVAAGFYDLTSLTISDGSASSPAYLSLNLDDSAGTLSINVPVDYFGPDVSEPQDANLDIVVDQATGQVVSASYYSYDPVSGLTGSLTPQRGGEILPVVLHGDLTSNSFTWDPVFGTRLSADLDAHEYSLDQLPSGTRLYVELWIEDFGGNADYVGAYVTVP